MTPTATKVKPNVGDCNDCVDNHFTGPFNGISEPGTYYFHANGWLFRVPSECLSPGHSPVLNIYGNEQCVVTRISDDPWMPIGKAREVCANWDLYVNF